MPLRLRDLQLISASLTDAWLFLFSAENKESLNCLEGPKQETGPRCPLVLIQFGLTISWQLWAMWLSSSMFRDKEKDTRHQFIRGSTPLPVKGLGSMTKGGPPPTSDCPTHSPHWRWQPLLSQVLWMRFQSTALCFRPGNALVQPSFRSLQWYSGYSVNG